LYDFVPAAAITSLTTKEFVSRRHIGINNLAVGFAHWPRAPKPELSQLILRVIEVRDGVAFVRATSDSGSVSLAFLLDFPSGKAHVDIQESSYRMPHAGDALDDAIAVVQFRKQVIGNGKMELWLPNGRRMDFEVVIPVNIDIAGTWRLMDMEIERLEELRSNG
jgi:hypothetical protein